LTGIGVLSSFPKRNEVFNRFWYTVWPDAWQARTRQVHLESKGAAPMRALVYSIVVFSLVICLAGLPAAAAREVGAAKPLEERSGGAMVVDALLLRPLGIVATVVGAAVCVVSLPFSAAAGNTDEACQKLVKEPAGYTFQRPLGEI
jgi:hypothetical protein